MKTALTPFFFAITLSSALSWAQMPPAPQPTGKQKGPGPCEQVKQACRSAGFVKGMWRKGDGLWLDCINPIMQGVGNVPGATKPLPAVDPALVSACRTKRPKFGMGKIGSIQPDKGKQQPGAQAPAAGH